MATTSTSTSTSTSKISAPTVLQTPIPTTPAVATTSSKKEHQMSISDFNLTRLFTKDLEEHIKSTIQIGDNICIFGRRGTGKTEISKQQIKASGFKEIYINLSVMERVDLGGYPNVLAAQQKQQFVDYLLPRFYQPMIEGDQKVVVLLDEVDKADQSLLAPLLELVQLRSINGFPLPNLYSIIMTGNLISEGGFRPSPPLLDRCEKYLVEADVSSWLNWSGSTRSVHPSIAAFITDNPKFLFGAVDPEDRYADPSPRGWTRASKILFRGEALKWSPELLYQKVCGCIGKDAGLNYSNYYQYYQILMPLIDKVFQGGNVSSEYKSLDPSKQLVASMIVMNRLSNILAASDAKQTEFILPRIGSFLCDVSPENVIASVRSQLTIHNIIKYRLDDNQDWKKIVEISRSSGLDN